MNFYIDGKKNLKVISALKDFNNRNKIIKEGSRIPNIINEHFATVGNRPQKHHLDYVDKCKSPISSFLFSKNYCQKYYLYRMINLMVYTPHLPNYSNVQVPSQLLFFRRYLVHLSDKKLIHQSSKLLQFRQYLRVTMILRQTTIDLSLYFQILIEYWRK